MAERPPRSSHPVGPGRVLALAYGFFTLAAGARATVQLITHGHRALVAYTLSALAASIYATGTVLVARTDQGARPRAATTTCLVELAGVALVGTLSLVKPTWFPEASVWSGFGSGYGYTPVALPLLALLWLHRSSPSKPATPAPITRGCSES